MFFTNGFPAAIMGLPCRLRILPMMLVMGGIFYLSHQSGDTLNLPDIALLDKVLHFIAYAVLGLTVCLALPQHLWARYKWLPILGAVLITTGYGFTDELHQLFIAGRSSSGADLLTDGIGGIVSAISYKKLFYPL
ncbi:MAG: hypothetical protein CSB34_06905 [Desulfobulbus propionicus]|nr:MAG: hypothetical protein CSB34_06905 [Desulfobulbus propionicus]